MFARADLIVAFAVLIAVGTAIGGTLIGGQLCAPFDDCGKIPTENDTTYDADWHGWPVPWKTDMSAEWQHENNWDKTLVLTFGTSVSFPLFVLSLGVWFALAIAAEGLTLVAWWLARRRRSGSLDPDTTGP
ncbi:MAG: hypothetical protein WEB04_07820 [Dehalococcoidia bacterium]